MFAIWAALYKAVHNSLRLITPLPPGASHRVRRSRSAPNVMHIDSSAPGTVSGTSSGYVSEEGNGSGPGRGALTPGTIATEKAQKKKRAFMHDPRSKVWHAYLAGAISALGVLVERKENRISLAQQLFVR